MVHPDDRSNVIQGVEYLKECEEVHDLEYRMLGKNGYMGKLTRAATWSTAARLSSGSGTRRHGDGGTAQ